MLSAQRIRKALLLDEFGRAKYLLLGQLLTSIGTGAVLASAALFLVRAAGLPATQVGLGMMVTGAISFAALPVIGPLTDRFGSRRVTTVSAVVAAMATLCFVWIDSLPLFVLFESLSNIGLLGMSVGQRALVGQTLVGGDRVRFQAFNRSTSNIGYALGALLSVPALEANTRTAYAMIFVVTAAAIAMAIPCVLLGPRPRLHHLPPSARPALTDLRYLVMTFLSGILTARSKLLSVAIPLWVVTRTTAPAGLTGILLFVNTVLVVLLQVRLSRAAGDLAGAAKVMTLGGFAFVAAFALLIAVPAMTTVAAIVTLFAMILLFTLGEMWTSAASWTYSYDLADPARHGQYQAVFALGRAGGNILGPALAGLIAALGATGWAIAGFVLFAACVSSALATPWAGRSRPRSLAAPEPIT